MAERTTWNGLFTSVSALRERQQQQKSKGLNDYCLLASVLGVNDEVRLHTRFIYSLLNPRGGHYQGTKFLELFLREIGKATEGEKWLNLDNVTVEKEVCPAHPQSQIDLLIHDGKRFIVIENKLNAIDQKQQVQRYIEAVQAAYAPAPEDILFIYLSKGRERPSGTGLGDLRLSGSKLADVDGNGVADYLNMSYRMSDMHGQEAGSSRKSLWKWLVACQDSVSHIDSLKYPIEDYKNTVLRATREYKSMVESLSDFLSGSGKEYQREAVRMAHEMVEVQKHWLHDAMTTGLDELLESELNSAKIERINDKKVLEPFLAESRKTGDFFYQASANYFANKNNTKNRGVFYRVTAGEYKDSAIIFLFYGSALLHAGYAHLDADSSRLVDLRERIKKQSLQLDQPRALRSAIFSNANTFSEKMTPDGIIHLADLANSPQVNVLKCLVASLVE